MLMLSRWCVKVKLSTGEWILVGNITANYELYDWYNKYTYTTYDAAEEACSKWRTAFPDSVYEPIFVEVEVEV